MVVGGAGNDTIYGDVSFNFTGGAAVGGDDILFGGLGDDTLIGDATNLILQQAGSDILFGGEGDDFLTGDEAASAAPLLRASDIFVFDVDDSFDNGNDTISDFGPLLAAGPDTFKLINADAVTIEALAQEVTIKSDASLAGLLVDHGSNPGVDVIDAGAVTSTNTARLQNLTAATSQNLQFEIQDTNGNTAQYTVIAGSPATITDATTTSTLVIDTSFANGGTANSDYVFTGLDLGVKKVISFFSTTKTLTFDTTDGLVGTLAQQTEVRDSLVDLDGGGATDVIVDVFNDVAGTVLLGSVVLGGIDFVGGDTEVADYGINASIV